MKTTASGGSDAPALTAGTGPATRLSGSELRWLLAGLSLGMFLASTEMSVVATALPTMAGDLGRADRLAWVVSAYLLTSTIVTPLYGKMSDLYGRRIVFQASIWMFLVGSVLCGLAQTMNQLVAARAVQGLGGGGLLSLAFVIVGDVVSPRERGRYMGVFTSVFAVSSVTGPLWGGLLVDGPGWRWVFWSAVPLAAVALIVTSRGLRLPFATRQRPIDWLGIALLVVAAGGLILVPVWGGQTFAWSSWPLLTTAGVGVAGTVLFGLQESRAAEPIVPLHLFRDRTIVAVFVMGFAVMAALLSMATFMPLFLQVSTGVSATRSGMLMTPQSLGITVLATVTGLLVTKTGRYKWSLLAGPVVSLGALLALTRIGPDTGALDLAPMLFLLGAGIGLVFPNLTLAVQNAVTMDDLGIGTSAANFFRSMGGAFGAATAGALLTARLDEALTARLGAGRLAELGGAEGLIRAPEVVRDLPVELRTAAVESVSDAVVSVIWLAVPLMVAVAIVATLVRETTLRTTAAIGGRSSPVGPVGHRSSV